MNSLLFGAIVLLVIWGLVQLYFDVKRVRNWRDSSQEIAAQSTNYEGLISAVAEGATGIGTKAVDHSGELVSEASSSEAAASGIGHLLHILGHFNHH